MFTILAVGEDFELLKTRAEVLRKTGANVVCSSGTAAMKFISEWEFDLIVLCHSVRQGEAAKIVEAAHSQGSKTLVLQMVSSTVAERQYAGIDAKAFVDPGCLIRSATELLNQQVRHAGVDVVRKEQFNSPPIRKRPQSFPADIAARMALMARLADQGRTVRKRV